MKIISILLFALIASYSQSQTLNLSSDVWPPFTNVEAEKSLAMDIVAQALGNDSITVNYKIVDFITVMEDINKGDADGSAALWKNDAREEILLFSSAYLENQLILVGRKGADVEVSSFEELEEKRIGVVEDYAYGEELKSGINNQIIHGESDQQNLERLLSQQVDYILVDAILIQYLLKYQLNDVTEFLEIGEIPMLTKFLHLAIRKDYPEAEQIIANFNAAINTMVVDGSYNEILELNWIRADVDGDGKLELILAGDKAGTSAPDNFYTVKYSDQGVQSCRYYVDGQIYDNWNDVPGKYKIPPPKVSSYPAQNDATMKIKF